MSYIDSYKSDLRNFNNDQLKRKYWIRFDEIELKDGRIKYISDDSHSSWWYGNIVISFDNKNIRSYMGHVCGYRVIANIKERYPEMPENEIITVDEYNKYIKMYASKFRLKEIE